MTAACGGSQWPTPIPPTPGWRPRCGRLPPTRDHGDGAALQAVRAGRSLLLADARAEQLEEIVMDSGDRRVLQALQPTRC